MEKEQYTGDKLQTASPNGFAKWLLGGYGSPIIDYGLRPKYTFRRHLRFSFTLFIGSCMRILNFRNSLFVPVKTEGLGRFVRALFIGSCFLNFRNSLLV